MNSEITLKDSMRKFKRTAKTKVNANLKTVNFAGDEKNMLLAAMFDECRENAEKCETDFCICD